MRRAEREITDNAMIESFLAQEHILRVAFYDDGDIYIVPVNYGYTNIGHKYVFYFHGAKAGRKYELSLSNPTVGFEIDGNYQWIGGETACEYSAAYQSVVGTGTIRVVDDKEEKIKGLNAIMKQATNTPEWVYSEAMLESVAVFRVDADKISCKGRKVKK
jgi:hypothetical protein